MAMGTYTFRYPVDDGTGILDLEAFSSRLGQPVPVSLPGGGTIQGTLTTLSLDEAPEGDCLLFEVDVPGLEFPMADFLLPTARAGASKAPAAGSIPAGDSIA
jgi:hypothetical protein